MEGGSIVSAPAPPGEELVHAERENRARGKHEAVEVYRHLPRIEDRDEDDRGKPAREGSAEQLEGDGAAGTRTLMAIGEMTMASGTCGHGAGRS